MSQSPPPTNYRWVGDLLTFDLDPQVTGVKIKFQKQGETNWITILETTSNPPSQCGLPANWGPSGTIWGATSNTSSGGDWGENNTASITNS